MVNITLDVFDHSVFYSCLKPLSYFNEIWLKSLQSPWIIEKAREFQKNVYFCFINYSKAFDYVDHNKLGEILQEMGIPDHLTCFLRIYMQVRKQQLELNMEKQTGSK